jgi:hypothetical protein
MSTSIKSAVREVLESLNPFGRKKVNPLTANPKTVDAEAISIGAQAVVLFRQAAQVNVSLDWRLVERRDSISKLATNKQYDLARTQLESYRHDVEASIALKEDAALYVDPLGMTDEEREHARQLRLSITEDIDALKLDAAADEIDQLAEVTARAQSRVDLGLDRTADILRGEINVDLPNGTLPKEKKEVETLQAAALKALEGDLTAEKIEKARALAKLVYSAVDAIQRRQDVAGADPGTLYERLKMRKNDIAKFPAEYRPPAIGKLCNAVDAADMDAQLKLTEFNRAAQGQAHETAGKAAVAAMGVLRQKIEAAMPALSAHDAEVRTYFAALKKMTPQIKVADTLPEVDSGSDTPWKAEKQAYVTARADVVKLQNEKKFREANVALTNCATLMKVLLDKRRGKIDTDIASTGDAPGTRNLVTKLDAEGMLAILTPQQQLDLVRKLPAGDANNPARFKVFANPAIDEAFAQAEAGVLKDVVKMLRGSDGKNATDTEKKAKQEWEENEKNWAAWAGKDPKRPTDKDIPKLQGVFQKIAEAQFKKLMSLAGLDPGSPPPGFPDPPVTVTLASLPPNDFGDTSPVFPAVIRINSDHRMIGDYKEMMDTILHENSHAWQNMIVAQYNGAPPFRPEDQSKVKGGGALPAMKVQAELFAENDASYTNVGEAYRHEPLEEQAWGFGGMSSQALLVPPPQRSFDSSKGLKNKFWVVTSLSRTASATIRLQERHGIYVDEWEGERAGDKKLTLEGVSGVSPAQALKVSDVINEYTLQLDLNAAGLRGRVVQKAEVEQEMRELAKTRHPGKKLDELSTVERKQLLDSVLLAEDWEASGSEDDQTAVVRAKDEVDVEHARLVLDESVPALA